jgi:hypothetical protein
MYASIRRFHITAAPTDNPAEIGSFAATSLAEQLLKPGPAEAASGEVVAQKGL